MSEIQVGEYVRVNGEIGKVTRIDEESSSKYVVKFNNRARHLTTTRLLKKHSFNIIDLIEIDDYVNGYKVEKINEPSWVNKYERLVYCDECEGLYTLVLNNDEIKTIVTHEQFENAEYKVEEG